MVVSRPALRPSASTLAALALGAAVGVILFAFVRIDPPSGVTASSSPFTDEAWNVVNARNFVLFGRFSTDDWNLHLVNGPMSVAEALVFGALGVGIVQARLLPIAATALAVIVLGLGLRRPLGAGPALLAAAAYGTSALVLYYGRLAYLEPLVALCLTAGALLVLGPGRRPASAPVAGAFAGILLAAAIGTKASAAFAAAGILVGAAVVGRRSPVAWRAIAGAALVIGVAALAWLLVVALPNRDAVLTDVRIWASEPLPHSFGLLARRVVAYPFRSDGAAILALPLAIGSLLALALLVRRWANLDEGTRAVAAVAAGWLILGTAILFVVPYRPNRYVVPMLPAAAMLVGSGAAVLLREPSLPRLGRRARAAIAVVTIALLAVPGPAQFAGWMATTGSTLPAVQSTVAALVPPGSAVQGTYAPVVALSARALVLVQRPAVFVNPGDLYETRGVRWVVARPSGSGDRPAWAADHAVAWATRETVLCFPWDGSPLCLYRLP